MALAAVAFAACDPSSGCAAIDKANGGFADMLLSRVRAGSRVGTSFLCHWAHEHGADSEGEQVGMSRVFAADVTYLPARGADALEAHGDGGGGDSCGGGGGGGGSGGDGGGGGGGGGELAAGRLLGQLFAHGFAPWADRRRTVRLFRRLSARLLYDVDCFISAFPTAAAAAAAEHDVHARAARDESLALARRVASDAVVCLCELVACCAMRLQLETRAAADGLTRRAIEGLRDATLGALCDMLPGVVERWTGAPGGALTPRARAALDALRAFQLSNWELSYAEPGVPALGLPDVRVARLSSAAV